MKVRKVIPTNESQENDRTGRSEFKKTSRRIIAEMNIRMNRRTEIENAIDDVEVRLTVRVPTIQN